MEYSKVKLGDICKTNQLSYSQKDNWEIINYLDTGNITQNVIDEIQELKVGVDKIPSRAKRKVQINDIIYSTVRPNQLHYGIIKALPENLLVSTGFTVISVDNKKADADYVYYYLTQSHITESLQAIGEQSTSAYPSIKPSDLENIDIDLPSLEIQKKVSYILRTIEEKMVLNSKLNANLTGLANTVFKEWYVDFTPFLDNGVIETELGFIPYGWRISTLEEVVDFSNGYAFKSKELLDSAIDKCYKVFKMGHIKRGGGLNSNGTKSWIEKEKCIGLDKYLLKTGDLLMCMTDMKDNVALLGHTALMDVNDEYIINQRVGLLRAKRICGIDYAYLYLLTNYRDFIEELRSRANRGVQVNLSTSEIKASKFVMAPEKINNEFNDIVRPLFEKIALNDKENNRLEQIRDILLSKLMSGDIELSDLVLEV